MEYLHIDPERKLSVIDKNIYGNFSEHLGHCIYEGVYVGEATPILLNIRLPDFARNDNSHVILRRSKTDVRIS